MFQKKFYIELSYPDEVLVKPPKTFEEQYQILKDRGCIIDDKNECIKKLSELNYYRLSGYLLPYKKADNTYYPVKFETIVDIYDFDTELRNWCVLALEDIELFMRTQVAYYHARKYGPLGYLKIENFSEQKRYEDDFVKLQHVIREAIKKNLKALPIQHHLEKYNGQIPIWVLVDYLTFSTISFFFSYMKNNDKVEMVKEFTSLSYDIVESHLQCCSVLRNVCAHHGMLYNRKLHANPAGIPEAADRKIFSRILAIKNLYPEKYNWNRILVPKLEQLINKYIKSIRLECIGFPPHNEWKEKLYI